MKQAKKNIKQRHAFIHMRTEHRKIYWETMSIISPCNENVFKELQCLDIMKHNGMWQKRKRWHYINKQTGKIEAVHVE